MDGARRCESVTPMGKQLTLQSQVLHLVALKHDAPTLPHLHPSLCYTLAKPVYYHPDQLR